MSVSVLHVSRETFLLGHIDLSTVMSLTQRHFIFASSLEWRTKWSVLRKQWNISQLPVNRAQQTWGPRPSSVSAEHPNCTVEPSL